MRFVDSDPAVARPAAEAERRMPELIKNTIGQIIEEMPVYGQAEFVSHDELGRSVAQNLSVAMRTLRGVASLAAL